CSESGDRGEFVGERGLLEVGYGFNLELFVEQVNLLWPETLNAQEIAETGGHERAELIVILQFSCRDQFSNLFSEGGADAFDVLELSGLDQFSKVFGQIGDNS